MSNEHNNGPAVPQGEPVAAWLKAKIEKHALLAADCPGSSSVVLKSALLRFLDRLPPVAATPATQAQDVPSGEVVAWMVYGNYTRQPFGMLSSAEAYMRGLRKSDPDGGYHIRPLTYTTPAPAPAQEFNKSVADAEIKAMYVESQGSDKGWLGIEGSYFIGGVVAARKQMPTLPAHALHSRSV